MFDAVDTRKSPFNDHYFDFLLILSSSQSKTQRKSFVPTSSTSLNYSQKSEIKSSKYSL